MKISNSNLICLTLVSSLVLLGESLFGLNIFSVYDDTIIKETYCQIKDLMEGSFGAFLTAVAGAGAVVACAFGVYRAGFGLIVVSSSSFIVHSLVGLWFVTLNCNAISQEEYNERNRIEAATAASDDDLGDTPFTGDPTLGNSTGNPNDLGGREGAPAAVAVPVGGPQGPVDEIGFIDLPAAPVGGAAPDGPVVAAQAPQRVTINVGGNQVVVTAPTPDGLVGDGG